MKAHVALPREVRREINRVTYIKANEYLAEHKEGFMRRALKVFYYCLNIKYGFGKKRIHELDEFIWNTMNEALEDEAFFEHLDHVVIDEMGLNLKREVIGAEGLPIDSN